VSNHLICITKWDALPQGNTHTFELQNRGRRFEPCHSCQRNQGLADIHSLKKLLPESPTQVAGRVAGKLPLRPAVGHCHVLAARRQRMGDSGARRRSLIFQR
jgi:hypothetical protein